MQREGADLTNMSMSDFLCDFCGSPWTDDRPMIEGHRGACVCVKCLSVAYGELVEAGAGEDPGERVCTLCLNEDRAFRVWESPATGARACVQCVKRAAGVVHKDPDIAWTKPGREGAT